MKENSFALFIVMLVVVVWSIYMAKQLLEKLEKKENQPLDSSENVNTKKFDVEGGDEGVIIVKKSNEPFKEVLKKENCSSSRKSYKDYNDKQNLTKYNHGTYRDEKGRFQSTKKWKKEQKHS
jgi:hypothetical protein